MPAPNLLGGHLSMDLQHLRHRRCPAELLGAVTRCLAQFGRQPIDQALRGVGQPNRVRTAGFTATAIHELVGTATVAGHNRGAASQRLEHRQPESLGGADREADVAAGITTSDLIATVHKAVEEHRGVASLFSQHRCAGWHRTCAAGQAPNGGAIPLRLGRRAGGTSHATSGRRSRS